MVCARLLLLAALPAAVACSGAEGGGDAAPLDVSADSAGAADDGADGSVAAAGDATTPPDLTTAADAAAADSPDISPALAPFSPGGILGTYAALDEAGAPLWQMQRLDTTFDASWASPWLAAVAGGGPFTVTWAGGWLVQSPGDWTLRAIAGGGVQVLVDGAPLASQVVPGAIVVEDGAVSLEAGWHELSVTWTYDPLIPVLHLLLAPPGGLPLALSSEELGFPIAPPAGAPTVDGIEVLSVGPFEARLAVSTSTPSVVEVQVAGATGLVAAASPAASWSTRSVVTVPLAKDLSWQVLATSTDLWGRPAGPAHGAFQTPGDGAWEPGALLGRYYEGMDFEELRMERLDPGVSMPAQADDDPGGSFGAPMPPNQFTVRWVGALRIDEAGPWTLWLGADDGQRLTLDGHVVAEDWRDHGTSWVGATRELAEGWHPIVVEMYENGGAAVARLEWEGPQTPRAPVPADNLGTPPAEDDDADPVLEELTVEPAGPGRALVRWRATELVRAELTPVGEPGLDGEMLDLGPWATGGQRIVDALPPGEVALTLQAVDRFGAVAAPVTATVVVEAVPEPAHEGAP